MSVAALDVERYTMSEMARGQLEGCGVTLSELFRLLHTPDLRCATPVSGQQRLTGYGLSVVVDGEHVVSVQLDGASRGNWSDWAVERAAFGDGDVAGADAMVRRHLKLVEDQTVPPARRRRTREAPASCTTTHVLDRVHPALRDEITRQVDGDYSRLVIHSATRVSINPPRWP